MIIQLDNPCIRIASLSVIIFCWLLSLNNTALAASPLKPRSLVIEGIRCEGNIKTDCSFITQKFYQTKGEVLSPEELADAKLRLGTLKQFKSISTRLEKGSQKGKVIVVFDVVEASQLQYGFSAGYKRFESNEPICIPRNSYFAFDEECASNKSKGNSYYVESSITDFNFLGTGKELSLNFQANRLDAENQAGQPRSNSTFNDSTLDEHVSVRLDYFDPHLFDSRRYFMSASIGYFYRNGQEYEINLNETSEPEIVPESLDDSGLGGHLELGMRFGKHSYVSLGGLRYGDNNGVIFNYGWDSRDDSVLPTSGSLFNIGTRGIFYRKFHSLTDKHVFSYHLGMQRFGYNVKQGWEVSPLLGLDYTFINQENAATGTYSGWNIGFDVINRNEKYFNGNRLGTHLNYIHQSDKFVYKLGLAYSHEDVE